MINIYSYDAITGFILLAVLLVIPFWRLLPRHGIPKGYALLAVLPVGALILLWVLAFKAEVDADE